MVSIHRKSNDLGSNSVKVGTVPVRRKKRAHKNSPANKQFCKVRGILVNSEATDKPCFSRKRVACLIALVS